MSELQPGVFLGHYELLVRIGRGGMASVWVARERSAVSGNQRLVAVKAMLPELATHSEFRSMFLSEVQIIQSTQHDNVVRVFEVSEHQNILYMVMEWVEGDSLRNIIRASHAMGALPPEIAVCIAADAASGLHAAHELRDWDGQLRGVVHCDVSPHNILVGLEGKAKLVDFGIASALERLRSTRDQEVIQGKVSYMSPEQAQGGQVDRRADIFALGIVLYEMSVGEQLFRGRNAAHTLELLKRGTIPRPSLLKADYPRKLEPIVLRALDRDPDQRFQTAEEFEYELSTYLTEEHAVVSHPVVARLLMQLLGSRIEKRREVITSIVASIDARRPIGNLNDRVSVLPDMSVVSEMLNFTATGRSETGLGIVARFEIENAGSVARSMQRVSNNIASMRWHTVLLLIVLLSIVAGSVSYFLALRPRTAETNGPQANIADAGSLGAAAAAVNETSATGSARSDGVMSIENLPVDSEQAQRPAGDKIPKGVVVRRGGKSFDELVDENAAAAARQGGIAENERTTVTAPSASAAPEPEPAPAPSPEPEAPPPGIDREAAMASLRTQAQLTRACRSLGPPPATEGQASVTFALSGRVKSVSISQTFAGTPLGNCIKSTFKDAHAPPFHGDPTTLTVPFQIPE
jgi:eukaryotic-like serine/threonine-protein kinase